MASKKGAAKRYQMYRMRIATLGVAALIAAALGMLASYHAGQRSVYVPPVLASQQVIAAAKAEIAKAYLPPADAAGCTDSTGQMVSAADYFREYLQVNAYANRATIRTCGDNGQLLAKINGSWQVTDVNLNLSARANPMWTRACEASDILVPDSQVRSENGSIDHYNLLECQALQHNKIVSPADL
ncbi:MAG TPA: hypothetical protein VLF69_03805 [Candidatus Saccharimonadales bacterium]|nr:hypothetical protein [Candidatus Saccharimonadales bacterium]